MKLNPGARGGAEPDALLSQRRGLIRTTSLVMVVCVAVMAALVAVMFSEDRKAWNDESQVTQTQGIVAEEVRSRGSCKGPDFDTRIEWIQDGETRTAWTGTCRSGPDVGDTVDVWVRDDGEITLTEPSTTVVFTVVGIGFFGGLGILMIFVLRSNLRRLKRQLAAIGHEV